MEVQWWAKLDGTRNGQLGQLTITIPAYKEDSETGEVLERNIIRDFIISTAKNLGGVKRYQVDDFGEYYAMPQNNSDYETYRENNPEWNCIPYDLEFSNGCKVSDILTELRDLYPNNEMYFDEDLFIARQIPSNTEDNIEVTDNQLKSILISEETSYTLSDVKNVCLVWGEQIESDFYTEDCTTNGSVYNLNVDFYEEKYCSNDKVGFMVDSDNVEGMQININGFGNVTIYDEATEEPILANRLEKGKVYVVKIKLKYKDGETTTKAYLLGQYIISGLAALIGEVSESKPYIGCFNSNNYICKNEDELRSYFCEKYGLNPNTIKFDKIPDSPFTINKIGEIMYTEQKDSVTSDGSAIIQADYYLYQKARITDSVTINTVCVPFLRTNIKVSYQAQNDDEVCQYIIDSISSDYSGATSSITMHKFYSLYNENEEE